MSGPLLEVRDLAVHFPQSDGLFGTRRRVIRAVDGVSFDVERGQTLGIVGESGCGKTTLARAILRLIEPTAGQVRFDGIDFLALQGQALRNMRRHIQIVFQDPYSSLNPRLTIGETIREGLLVHRIAEGAAADARVAALLDEVGLQAAYATRYPHEFSGGQRQRVGIARALALEPQLLICDEPVSALDVSVQAQVINLLNDLKRSRGLSLLFIAHDLSVVEHMADHVAVMYLGRIVEQAPAAQLYAQPCMPYTQALLSAVPVPDPGAARTRIVLDGDPPSPAAPPSGCRFHPRCFHPARDAACSALVPPLEPKHAQHLAACIKQPPTVTTWPEQQRAGGTHPPTWHPAIAPPAT